MLFRSVAELPAMIYYKSGNGVAVNLYTSSKATIHLGANREVGLSQQTNYPNSGQVVLKVDSLTSSAFPIKLRIPLWCKNASVAINGVMAKVNCEPGSFAILEREWKRGDQITLQLPMEWRLVKGRERQAGRVAIMRGPLLFGLNPTQEKSLMNISAVDLGRLIVSKKMLDPLAVHADGFYPMAIGCHLKAGSKMWAMDNPGDLDLLFSEFADPGIRCTYFKTPNLAEAVEDELIGLNFN